MKVLLLVFLVLLVGGAALASYRYGRWSYESPDYTVERKDGRFELRSYPDLVVVSTSMDEASPMEGGTFMRLFRYIAKGNEAEEKIAMTTPVLRDADPSSNGGERMSFILPRSVAQKGPPAPASENVHIGEVIGGRFASYRYQGTLSASSEEEAKSKLQKWVRSQSLDTVGTMIIANYDPPFTPPFLRRNEVLWRLQG
ncbi:MAG: heme-binding protein [Verrucomicrobiota bacterium]